MACSTGFLAFKGERSELDPLIKRNGSGEAARAQLTKPTGRRWPKAKGLTCYLLILGADSRFFALLGSAPQELNTVRPEAKLTC